MGDGLVGVLKGKKPQRVSTMSSVVLNPRGKDSNQLPKSENKYQLSEQKGGLNLTDKRKRFETATNSFIQTEQ